MKPNPFSLLKNFTVPVVNVDGFLGVTPVDVNGGGGTLPRLASPPRHRPGPARGGDQARNVSVTRPHARLWHGCEEDEEAGCHPNRVRTQGRIVGLEAAG